MAENFPECPASLKQIQHYLKTAVEHDNRDPVVAYWCRLHALQVGLKLTSKKTPEETKLLMAIMDWLEQFKKDHADNDAVSNEVAAQAHLENYALKLFLYADKQDREGNFGKNVVKAFYTSGMIYDVMATFGELTEEVLQNRKYAKWKAAYIHNCLKNGETPVPGPMPDENEDNLNEASGSTGGIPSINAGFPSGPNSSFPEQPPVSNFQLNPPGPLITLGPDVSATNLLPSVPHTPDLNPGGFRPYVPSVPSQLSRASQPIATGDFNQADYANVTLTADQVSKAQKYCKWASSALTYDDAKTAITNLKMALELLQTGNDPGQ